LTNVQPSDRVCFCPQRVEERDRATFSFRLIPGGSDTEEEDVVKCSKGSKLHILQSMQDQPGESLIWDSDDELGSISSGWRTKKRKIATVHRAASSGVRRCGKCGKPGHYRRTCQRRM
jgi:hypothetical protein